LFIKNDRGHSYPVADETRILPDREAPFWLTLRGQKEISSLSVRRTEVIIDRLPGLFGDLKPYRPAGLLLPDCRTLNRVSVRGNVLDFESDDVATSSLLSMARSKSARSRLWSPI
jgi:hypothetical protein